ncbi:hypothetical protein F5148DRAFT_1372456 [Russula earlei]|uniref:Uncharacterized protein n=1 Tax=Russula earlei TaxID=71964 RepID=A0ACC0UP94_9AGAM|nr:hypothetical protein F5148DRAFT_1372456 [Russula earlei]
MVTTPSIAADHEAKRQRITIERAKVVNLSKQLQIRLQYARLKVEHGWQRQSLNEVENLYFRHSTLKGKSKAPAPSSSSSARPSSSLCAAISSPLTASGPSPKAASASSRTTKGAKVAPEANQAAAPPASAPSPPPTVFVSSPPPAAVAVESPRGSPPLQLSTPAKSASPYATTRGTPTPSGGTPTQMQVSEGSSTRSATLSPSALSAFTQSHPVAQQQLSSAATMDFSSLSPFVTTPSFSSTNSSIAAPSSFVSPVPPSPFSPPTLAYLPSPFAPPPSSSAPIPSAPSLPMSQFATTSYPVAMPAPDVSASLSTFSLTQQSAFPSHVQTPHPPSPTPTPTPASVSTIIQPAPAPSLPPTPTAPPSTASKRTRSPAPPGPRRPGASTKKASTAVHGDPPARAAALVLSPVQDVRHTHRARTGSRHVGGRGRGRARRRLLAHVRLVLELALLRRGWLAQGGREQRWHRGEHVYSVRGRPRRARTGTRRQQR